MSIGRIEEYLEGKRWEYLTATKREKGRILDEVCAALRYHRKAAIRTLRQKPGQKKKTEWSATAIRGRGGERPAAGVGSERPPVWQALGTVPFDARSGAGALWGVNVTAAVREQLLGLSAATIDRRLHPYRVGPGPAAISTESSAGQCESPRADPHLR